MVPPRRLLNYEHEQMERALADVNRGIPVATAARQHGVPRVTLLYKARGKTPIGRKMGPSTVLTTEDEANLVTWIKHVAKAGFPVTRNQVADSVQQLLKNMNRTSPLFTDGRPGRTWFKSFLKRNPSVSIRVAENLTVSRACVTQEVLSEWYTHVYTYLQENNLTDILMDPNRVFNGDESAFFLNPKGNKVLATKGDKQVYSQVNPDEKECLTVLLTANAAGVMSPPSVVFKYERVPADLSASIPQGWGVGRSETGWMNAGLFYEYLANVFHPWLVECKIPLPVILFIDGHASHLTLHASRFCDENGILLVALCPNATHLIQPMDVSVFRSLKGRWKFKVHDWRLKNVDNPVLKKRHFAPLLKEALDELPSSIFMNGFRTCGLVPWNPLAPFEHNKSSYDGGSSRTQRNKHNLQHMRIAHSVIEDIIGPEKLQLFRTTSTMAEGNEDKSLHEIWKKLGRNLSPGDICEQSLENEADSSAISNLGGEIDLEDSFALSSEMVKQNAPEENTTHPSSDNSEPALLSLGSNGPDTTQQPCVTKPVGPSIANSSNIPSPFKKVLFWPEEPQKKTKRNEKVPRFVLSETWREYHENKARKKQELEEINKTKALERQRKRLEKEELKKKKQVKKPQAKITIKKKRKLVSSSDSDEEWIPSGESLDDVSLGHSDSDISDYENIVKKLPKALMGEVQEIDSEASRSGNSVNFEIPGTIEVEAAEVTGESQCVMETSQVSVEVQKTIGETSLNSECSGTSEVSMAEFSNKNKNNESVSSQPACLKSDSISEGTFVLALMKKSKRYCKHLFEIVNILDEDHFNAAVLKPLNRLRNVYVRDEQQRTVVLGLDRIVEKLPSPLVYGSDTDKRYQFSYSLDVPF